MAQKSWNLLILQRIQLHLGNGYPTAQETWSDNELDVIDLVFSGEVGSNIDIAFGLQYREEAF